MTKFKNTLDELMIHCREGLSLPETTEKLLFFNALEYMEVHFVPRLLVLLEGHASFSYVENGRIINQEIIAPAFFYCSQNGYLAHFSKHVQRMLSFSYFPKYIRAMHVDFDGKNLPPTGRDVYYHTVTPLPAVGMQILECIQQLHDIQQDDIAQAMLRPLLELTVNFLSISQSAPVSKERPLWHQINTFLREHRIEPLSRSQVAKLFVISPGYLSQLCREYVGKSFSDLKLSYQFEHALNLMLHTRLTIDEIAQQSGFSGANYFIRRFKKQYGVTPHYYRNHPPETSLNAE